MTTSKRAAAHELAQTKVASYKNIIREIVVRLQKNPLGTDYSGELEGLHKAAPKDRALILQAEREVYAEMRKK